MRSVTINIPPEVAHRLEVRAAIDDLSLKQGIEQILIELVYRFESESSNAQPRL